MDDIMKKSMVIYLLTDTANGKQYVGQTTQTSARRPTNLTNVSGIGSRLSTRRHLTVICVELGIIFESVTKAAKFAGVTPTFIVRSCRKLNRTAAKFHWRYVDESFANETARQNIIASHGKRSVLCIELNRIFSSIKEAADWAGVGVPAIAKACNNSNKTSAGFHWAYCEPPFHSEETRKKISQGHRRSIICIELGMTFSSITEASEWAGVSVSSITHACKKKSKTSGGYHWEYAD